MKLTRSEKINLTLFFDTNKLTDRDIKRIREFHKNPDIGQGDTVKSHLWFDIDYYGDAEKQIKFCIDMMDKSKVLKADIKELKRGRSILFEMAHKLDSIIYYVENNK